ncbi:hypothetical protein JQK87_07370 [Streptomyces sp. G44]|uniref:hypothetical protein n=1 Tax=Streptomyces sp. G44 TaxID=2807632 RepID=UPI0019609227|nr:hypothetical protein [Streptomyces sp. G44]MBM7168231.1 hypothetical protein [Streptomyces sp. G44]
MLYAFAFERIGVVVSDLYFLDPNPLQGQETPERGVRLELRVFESGELPGSIYAARPITIGRPLWRVDLLQAADAAPNTFDRTHHHPDIVGWEPGARTFVEELSHEPLAWLTGKLTDIPSLLHEAGISPDEISAADADGLRTAAPEIVDTVRRVLERVWAGELGRPTTEADADGVTSVRASWL